MIYFEVFITLSYFITLLMRAGVHVPQRSHGMSSLDGLQELVLAFHYMSFLGIELMSGPGGQTSLPSCWPTDIFYTRTGAKDGKVSTQCTQDRGFNRNNKTIIKIRAESIVTFNQISLYFPKALPLLGRLTYSVIPTASNFCLCIFVEDWTQGLMQLLF